MQIIQSIQSKIYEIRGERVVLDRDLAALYETETKFLNLAVKRNSKRFPEDFMFQLTRQEFESVRLQIETSERSTVPLRLQFATSNKGGTRYLPYGFTEQAVAMLSGILNSDKAINMNIAIMRAFVAVRKIVLKHTDTRDQLNEIKEKIGEHDAQLNEIYDTMDNLLDINRLQKGNGQIGNASGLNQARKKIDPTRSCKQLIHDNSLMYKKSHYLYMTNASGINPLHEKKKQSIKNR